MTMPRRASSDEEDNEQLKRKTKSKTGISTRSSRPIGISKKRKSAQNATVSSVISAWAKRRTVENLDAIEDVDSISPRKGPQKPKFEVGYGIPSDRLVLMLDIGRIPPVSHLAVHKNKVAEVSIWLKQFPHHRKVRWNDFELTVEVTCSFWPCWSRKVDYCAEFSERIWRRNR